MSEIDAIPEDIMAMAKRCLNDRSLSILDSVARALLSERTAQREQCADLLKPWLRRDHISLHCGEVTAQEFRTVYAVVKYLEGAIRNSKQQEPT